MNWYSSFNSLIVAQLSAQSCGLPDVKVAQLRCEVQTEISAKPEHSNPSMPDVSVAQLGGTVQKESNNIPASPSQVNFQNPHSGGGAHSLW